MFSFFRSSEQTAFNASSTGHVIVTLSLQEQSISTAFKTISFKPKVVLGFVSPSLDFNAIASKLKQALPAETTLIL